MSNFSNARTGRIYLGIQSAFGTAYGSPAGTFLGTNCCRHSKCKLMPMNPRTPRDDKTGTLSRTPGVGGLRKASVAIDMDLAANGVPGAKPDCDPLLQSIFGQAPTIVLGTSVTYNLLDSFVPISIGHYRLPSTVQQQVAWGVCIDGVDFGFNDGVIAKVKFTGSAAYVPDTLSFSTLDTGGKGGITSIGSEPGSPVTTGGVAVAFQGSLAADSNVVATVKNGTLSFKRPATPQYAFGTEYIQGFGLGTRECALKFDLWDDDSSMMTDLLSHGVEDVVFSAVLVIGNVPGNTWTFTLTGLQIEPPGLDDSSNDRWVASFGNQMATVPTLGLTNELILQIT